RRAMIAEAISTRLATAAMAFARSADESGWAPMAVSWKLAPRSVLPRSWAIEAASWPRTRSRSRCRRASRGSARSRSRPARLRSPRPAVWGRPSGAGFSRERPPRCRLVTIHPQSYHLLALQGIHVPADVLIVGQRQRVDHLQELGGGAHGGLVDLLGAGLDLEHREPQRRSARAEGDRRRRLRRRREDAAGGLPVEVAGHDERAGAGRGAGERVALVGGGRVRSRRGAADRAAG